MAGSSTKSWWDYSKWVTNVARNSRITPLEGTVELPMARVVVAAFWDCVNQTGTRPWLDNKFRRLSVNSQYSADPTAEPAHVIGKMVEVIGRDLKKIPMTDAEWLLCAFLIAATNNRNYGTTPYYGGVIGATVTIV